VNCLIRVGIDFGWDLVSYHELQKRGQLTDTKNFRVRVLSSSAPRTVQSSEPLKPDILQPTVSQPSAASIRTAAPGPAT
jgi:hypothetical protein